MHNPAALHEYALALVCCTALALSATGCASQGPEEEAPESETGSTSDALAPSGGYFIASDLGGCVRFVNEVPGGSSLARLEVGPCNKKAHFTIDQGVGGTGYALCADPVFISSVDESGAGEVDADFHDVCIKPRYLGAAAAVVANYEPYVQWATWRFANDGSIVTLGKPSVVWERDPDGILRLRPRTGQPSQKFRLIRG